MINTLQEPAPVPGFQDQGGGEETTGEHQAQETGHIILQMFRNTDGIPEHSGKLTAERC